MLAGLASLGRGALDVILPPQCLGCDSDVAEQGTLCGACFGAMTFLGDPLCARCGHGFAHLDQAAGRDTEGLVCRRCAVAPPAWRRARGALLYDEASRGLVLGLKYADRVEHARPLAALMARAGAALLHEAELIVPVPLHRMRLLSRRYNQAALLARALSAPSGRPCGVDALVRTRRTIPLARLDAETRADMLQDAIGIRPAAARAMEGRRVLLVDDVLTSGATARACAGTLLAAGAGSVDVLVAARVGYLGFA